MLCCCSATYAGVSFLISNAFAWLVSLILGLCIIESILNKESSITLMSPNYPLGFPEDELMTWQFVVPSNLRASVFFHNYSLSNCERKEERVEYYLPGSVSNPEVFKLSDSQPANIAGSFNLSLQGCDQDAQNPGILRLLFQVVVQHPQIDESKYWFAPSVSLCISLSFYRCKLQQSQFVIE